MTFFSKKHIGNIFLQRHPLAICSLIFVIRQNVSTDRQLICPEFLHFPRCNSPPRCDNPPVGQGLVIIESSRSYSDTPHSVGLLWMSDQSDAEPLPDNKRHVQQTDIHASGGIRTRNHSKRAAVGQRLRPRSHWDQLECF